MTPEKSVGKSLQNTGISPKSPTDYGTDPIIGALTSFWRCMLGMPGSLDERARIGSEFSAEEICGIDMSEWPDEPVSDLFNRTCLNETPIVRTPGTPSQRNDQVKIKLTQ